MRTAEVAAQAGVNVETLRYYERRGLLAAPDRRPSGYREYTPEVVGRVRFVKRAQQLGFSLEEVEALLDLAAGGPTSCESARALAVAKIAALDEKIESLAVMRESLQRLVETCERPPRLRDCPLIEGIAETGDVEDRDAR